MEFFEHRVGGCRPRERLAGRVIMLDKMIDPAHEFADVAEGPAADRTLGDHVKPALDLIQPCAVGRRGVDVVSRSLCQPCFHRRMRVRRIVIHGQMHGERRWHVLAMCRRKLRNPRRVDR